MRNLVVDKEASGHFSIPTDHTVSSALPLFLKKQETGEPTSKPERGSLGPL